MAWHNQKAALRLGMPGLDSQAPAVMVLKMPETLQRWGTATDQHAEKGPLPGLLPAGHVGCLVVNCLFSLKLFIASSSQHWKALLLAAGVSRGS